MSISASSNTRTPLGRTSQIFKPNASTDRIRPKSSLSNYGADGTVDEEDEPGTMEGGGGGGGGEGDFVTPTPRRTTSGQVSDVGTGKRLSVSRLPAPSGGRLSFGLRDRGNEDGAFARPGSSRSNQSALLGVGELADDDDDETF